MSKAAELAKWGEVSTNGQVSGRRNIVINGAMNVAQRGTSSTGLGAAAGYFTLDRWRINTANSAGRFTMTQTADGPNGVSANCTKLDCTTADASIAAGELLMFQQPIEGQNLQAIGKGVAGAKQVTVSFYAKANAAKTYVCALYDNDNARNISKTFTVATDWTRHEITFDADVDDGSSPFDDDNAVSLYLNIWLHAGTTYTGGTLATSWENYTAANTAAGIDSFYSSTDNNFFITGVQLEVGSVATPFEHRSFGEELQLCNRYFTELNISSTDSFTHISTGIMGVYNSETQGLLRYFFPVQMRAVPTLSFDALSSFDIEPFDVAPSAIASGSGTTKALTIDVTDPSSRTKGFAFMLTIDTTTGYIRFDSEL
jgi:hypothetical protein